MQKRSSKSEFQMIVEAHPEGLTLKDRKGGDISEWPTCLRVREFPEAVGVRS